MKRGSGKRNASSAPPVCGPRSRKYVLTKARANELGAFTIAERASRRSMHLVLPRNGFVPAKPPAPALGPPGFAMAERERILT
jgi:hypothetical protein